MTLDLFGDNADDLVRDARIRAELQAINQERVEYDTYRSAYQGERSTPYGTELFRQVFNDAFLGFRENWSAVVVDAVEEKLDLVGVAIGSPSLDTVEEFRPLSRQIWEVLQHNEIDEESSYLHEGALVEGTAYAIVWPDDEIGATVNWQPAWMCRVRYSDENPRKALWAIKHWQRDDGTVFLNYYTPDRIYKYTVDVPSRPELLVIDSQLDRVPEAIPSGWRLREDPIEHPFSRVPVVEFPTRGGSELKNVIPMQDGVNKLLMDMFVASEFSASPQKYAETNQQEPVDGWYSGPGEVWHFQLNPDSEGRFHSGQYGQFATTDPQQFLKPVEMGLQHVAMISRTPTRYFFTADRGGRGDAPSGDSLIIEERPHNAKVARRQTSYGNRWYQVVRLIAEALEANGMLDRSLPNLFPFGEMIWKDPRSEYRASILEEAKMMIEIGVPFEFVVSQLGLNTAEVDMILELKEEERRRAEEQQQQQVLGPDGQPTSASQSGREPTQPRRPA